MFRKFVCLSLILSQILLLSGCWNYRGLNEMSVVVGIAVDKAPECGGYQFSFEIVDISTPIKDKGAQSKLVESEGKTVFDSVRNAKKRINNKLYFGQVQLIVVSEEIARSKDLSGILDWFLRDGEPRETIYIVISQGKTAREIISSKCIGQSIISVEIQKIIENDESTTASTSSVELYKVFSILRAQGESLTLPAIHNVTNNGETVVETNGTAVFKENKMVGYLTPDESKYYLIAVDEVKGGVLTISSAGDQYDDISLEISENSTKRSFEFKDGKIKILINTDTTTYLGEAMVHNDALDDKLIAAMEDAAAAKLENEISQVVQRAQSEYDSDIFGFGNMIYKKDFRLWNQLKDTWDEQFKALEVEVHSEVHILNTGAIQKS